eukprot:TRINITY_DN10438_c0_g1_i1.p3 TRINITY_DN10438_c0_g1~~TRINITY_DN10438_c0_g1_i1.p3  ORF type:complete len:121 (+),score=36.17 TRINITY_DN10438_c0_g1_i1:1247-1609(+)
MAALSMQGVLDDPLGRELFRAFCISERNSENLMFWMAVEKYRATYTRDINNAECAELLAAARAVYDTFLDEDHAPSMVWLDRECVEQIEAQLATAPFELFDTAQEEVFGRMKLDLSLIHI